jgi:hypothetical protein
MRFISALKRASVKFAQVFPKSPENISTYWHHLIQLDK